jgi:hypothetical protein
MGQLVPQSPLDENAYPEGMTTRDGHTRAAVGREIEAACDAYLDDIAADPDHRAGVRDAAWASEMHRRLMTRAANLRRTHLDAAAVEEEMDLAGLAELAGGVTRQRASQLRTEARKRRVESTGESA